MMKRALATLLAAGALLAGTAPAHAEPLQFSPDYMIGAALAQVASNPNIPCEEVRSVFAAHGVHTETQFRNYINAHYKGPMTGVTPVESLMFMGIQQVWVTRALVCGAMLPEPVALSTTAPGLLSS